MTAFYLVEYQSKDDPWIDETHTRETRADVIKGIYSGQYDTGSINRVIEVDVEAGTSRDVSKEFAEAVAQRSFDEAEKLCSPAAEFVGHHDLEGYDEPERRRKSYAWEHA